MGAKRVIRSKSVGENVEVIVERMSLGQVTDYDTFRVADGEREYLGGGSKREAQRIFDRTKS